MPIGNLTSQIFANIYLNELDRFIKHTLRVKYYVRYGDDFVILHRNKDELQQYHQQIISFIEHVLFLRVHTKHDIVLQVKQGVRYLGVVIFSKCTVLNRRTIKRINSRLHYRNYSSYNGLVVKFGTNNIRKKFMWQLHMILFNI